MAELPILEFADGIYQWNINRLYYNSEPLPYRVYRNKQHFSSCDTLPQAISVVFAMVPKDLKVSQLIVK